MLKPSTILKACIATGSVYRSRVALAQCASAVLRLGWMAAICLSAAGTQAQNQLPLDNIAAVSRLTNAQAAKGLPVAVEGTVTFVQAQDGSLFLEQDGVGIYLDFSKELGLRPGDRVAATGITAASFRPQITAQHVRLIAHGSLPKAVPANFSDLIKAKYDSQFVEITGRVLSSAFDMEEPMRGLRVKVLVPEGTIEGTIARPGKLRPEDLLDVDVRLTGVAGGAFDSSMQMAGVWLDMYSDANITVLHRPEADPWSIPAVAIDQAIFGYRSGIASQRVRIAGTLTYFEPGALAVIESDGKAILVETRSTQPLVAGMGVEATGFPDIADDSIHLDDSELRATNLTSKVQPRPIGWENASAGQFAYNLVSMEGDVVAEVKDSRLDLFVIRSEGRLFSASLRHNASIAGSQAIETPSVGSRVRVSGVCFVDAGNHWRDRLWFDLRMRSLSDIAVLHSPSWWTVKRLAYVVSFLALTILAAASWVWMLGQRVRKQTAVIAQKSLEESARERQLARQEQQRSHVLELITSSAPLLEVLREITGMVSSRLHGASCWFELNGNPGVSADLERPSGPSVAFQELFSPDNQPLGYLLSTPLSETPEGDIAAALLAGARLAELAIDTRRLYSDLRHRSEHDLLTDIPNRFSMEKQLDQMMQGAQRNGDIFGLVYVDLDKFKQVNDRYGHRTGDLYLQEVTRRMKFQLRNGDMLARIGGDEFIALVPILRSRSDAEEIAVRLERCFDDTFAIDGYRLEGSASVGLAVYPEDGTTKEELQRSADAAMYANKEGKKHLEKLAEAMRRVASENYLQ